jgi:hypothetical protein
MDAGGPAISPSATLGSLKNRLPGFIDPAAVSGQSHNLPLPENGPKPAIPMEMFAEK